MGANTKIEWAHHTFNPWVGCSKVSSGCQHCYAEEMMDHRYGKAQWGPNGTRVRTSEANWRKPFAWDKAAAAAGERHRVFCASLADVFEDRPELIPWRAKLFDLIYRTPNTDWLILTKRIDGWEDRLHEIIPATHDGGDLIASHWLDGHAPHNVWIGTSVENQEQADIRIPELLKIPAKVRFLSMEPLLGPVDLEPYMVPDHDDWECDLCGGTGTREYFDAPDEWEEDIPTYENHLIPCRECVEHRATFRLLHWVIVGGESGHNARPMHPDWARSLRDQCQAAGVPFLFKQHGEWRVGGGSLAEVESYKGPQAIVFNDGRWFVKPAPIDHPAAKFNPKIAYRLGKHAAGRELDGRTWDEVPE